MTTAALLTPDQECALARIIEVGLIAQAQLDGDARLATDASCVELRQLAREGEQARALLIEANLGLARQVAYADATRHRLDADDLIQEGAIALMNAAVSWDYSRDIRFSTYATCAIQHAVWSVSATRGGAWHVSAWVAKMVNTVRRAQTELEVQGLPATEEAVALRLGKPVAWVREKLTVHNVCGLPDDLDIPMPGYESASEADAIATAQLLSHVNPRERRVLTLRYGLVDKAHSVAQTAASLGCSHSTVRRLEQQGLAAMRASYAASGALAA